MDEILKLVVTYSGEIITGVVALIIRQVELKVRQRKFKR